MSGKSELRVEFLVGSFVALVLAGLAVFTIFVSGAAFFRTNEFKIEVVMPDAMGLRRNDFVIAKGTSVGTVDSVFYDKDGVHVVAVLDAPVEFYEGYHITVVSTSILGGRQLVIHEGDSKKARVEDVMSLVGAKPADLMEDATEAVRQVREFLETDALENLRNFSQNISEISDRLNAGEGTLGKLFSANDELYTNLNATVADARAAVADIRTISARLETGEGTLGKLLSSDDEIYANLNAAVADARAAIADIKLITARLETGEGTLGKLLSADDELYTNLNATIANLQKITTRLETGEGTLGKLLSADTSIYDNLDGVLRDARETLDDVREASTLGTVSSVLFGGL